MKRILLIEDEKMIREMYIKKLEEEGFVVFQAMTVKEGEIFLKDKEINLMLLDVILPEENGLDYLERMKKEKRSIPPVIILSNLEGKNYRERAKRLDVKDYFLKTDYVPSEIVELIKKYI